jgi:hypothetical protein
MGANENAIGTAFLILVVEAACYDVAVNAGKYIVSLHFHETLLITF